MFAHFTMGFNLLSEFLYNPKETNIYPEWFIQILPIDGAFESYLRSITLFRDWFCSTAIDGIVWTLEIEIKFYLYVALFLFVLKRSPETFTLLPGVITLISIVLFNTDINYPLSDLSFNI